MRVADDVLMAHALGALDPGDTRALSERLHGDASARLRLSGIGVLTGTHPGAGGALRLAVESAPLLGPGGTPRLGERARLALRPPVPAQEIRPILWRETSLGREVLYPRPSGGWVTLDRFRQEGEDVILDLVLAAPGGVHVYSVALLPGELFDAPWARTEEVQRSLWDAFALGELPGARFMLDVES